jgi:hypothetical protein
MPGFPFTDNFWWRGLDWNQRTLKSGKFSSNCGEPLRFDLSIEPNRLLITAAPLTLGYCKDKKIQIHTQWQRDNPTLI